MKEGELERVAEVLSRSFYRDPLQNYTFPDADERAQKSPMHFQAALLYGHLFGEVYTADGIPGASVWLRPGETEMTPKKAEQAGFLGLPEKIGEDAFNRFFTAIAYAEQIHKTDVPEPHWYTMVLGVDPELQGQGFGRNLMRPIFERSAAEGVPIYLETAQPKNVTFYERLGFRLLRDMVEPSSGVRMWTFRREP
ncbi:GNAT family N-acetyltransferase [soil metagenome]